jgi:hypothetical protein
MYFHSSNLDYMRNLCNEKSFDPVYQYPSQQAKLAHPNEYGRIRTYNIDYHFLLGNLRNSDCPWCGCSDVHVKKEENKTYEPTNPFDKDKYWMQCCRCGSRGPVVFVDPMISIDDPIKDYILSLIKERYSQRLGWDSKLENIE